MKTIKFLALSLFLFTVSANAQITKGNWMVGGNGSFSSSNNKSDTSDSKSFTIDLTPNIGYFIFDKLSGGTKLSYFYSKYDSDSGNSEFKSFYLSPFARYYFLKEENEINLFLESSYKFSLLKENKNNTALSLKGGTVFFLNSSVGLEISLEYLQSKFNLGQKTNSILFGFGIQVHLEKDK